MSLFSINTNLDALSAYNALSQITDKTQKAQLRLATGKQINSVADNTSGFAVGSALNEKVQLMQSAQSNVGSAQDMLSTVESQLTSVANLITSIKGEMANATNPATNTSSTEGDIKALASEIANIFSQTKYNSTQLLSSVAAGGFNFQTGASSSDTLAIDFNETANGTLAASGSSANTVTNSYFTVYNVGAVVSQALTSLANVSGTVSTTANNSIANLSTVLSSFESAVNTALSAIGNYDQRLSIKNDFLTSAISNSQASVSRLFDANIAVEQMNATKGQIQEQIATSMLSQLNSAPQNLLRLFQ